MFPGGVAAIAYRTGIIGTDERHLHPDPYPSREAWCQARIDATLPRLDALDPALPTILVSHFPLTREPTRILRYPAFAQHEVKAAPRANCAATD